MFQYVNKILKRFMWERTAEIDAAHTAITTGWENMNLRRFFAIKNLPVPTPGDPVAEADYDMHLISILVGVPMDQLESAPLGIFYDLKRRVDWIKTTPIPDVEERRRYVIDCLGYTRVFDVQFDVKRWNTSQYIDYQTLGGNTETPEGVAALLCCYLIPAGHAYGDGYDFEELKGFFMDHFPALDAFALHNFFVMRSLASITSTKTSWALIRAAKTRTERKRMMKLLIQLRVLMKSGGGSAWSTLLPKSKGFLGRRHLVWKLSKLSIR